MPLEIKGIVPIRRIKADIHVIAAWQQRNLWQCAAETPFFLQRSEHIPRRRNIRLETTDVRGILYLENYCKVGDAFLHRVLNIDKEGLHSQLRLVNLSRRN